MDDCVIIDATNYPAIPKGTSPTPVKKSLFWVDGPGLLRLAEWAINGLDTTGFAARGDGTYEHPWILTGNPKTWIWVANELKRKTGVNCYMWICGRVVKKIANGYYMVDAGGTNRGQAWNQKAFWNNRKGGWDWENFERGGPSYRNFSNYMENIRSNSSKRLSEEVWAQHKAEKLRRVLLCDLLYRDNLAKKGDWTTGQILPVLAATMFLAEPARSIRAFVANRMLIDLMQAGITYTGRMTQFVWKTTLWRDPHDTGGDMPAAMTGSGEAGKIGINPDKLKVGTGQYTQAKEVALICHMFSSLSTFTGTTSDRVDKVNCKQIPVNSNPALNRMGTMTNETEILGWMKYLIQFLIRDWKL